MTPRGFAGVCGDKRRVHRVVDGFVWQYVPGAGWRCGGVVVDFYRSYGDGGCYLVEEPGRLKGQIRRSDPIDRFLDGTLRFVTGLLDGGNPR